jgi:glycine oxidase
VAGDRRLLAEHVPDLRRHAAALGGKARRYKRQAGELPDLLHARPSDAVVRASADVAVIGAGAVGLSVACRLRSHGATVVVFDASSRGGRGSRAAAGVAIPYIRLAGDAAMVAFTRQARPVLEAELAELTAGEPGQLRTAASIIRLVRDQAHRAATETAAAREPGWLGRWAEAEELRGWEPLLVGDHVQGGFVDDAGFVVDADGYVNLLMQRASALGAEIALGNPVTLVKPGPRSVTVTASDRIVTEEDVGFLEATTPDGLLFLTAFLRRTLPGLCDAHVMDAWSGLRAVTASGRPFVGEHPDAPRVVVAAGHGGQGILTAALTADAVCDLLVTGSSPVCEAFVPRPALAGVS